MRFISAEDKFGNNYKYFYYYIVYIKYKVLIKIICFDYNFQAIYNHKDFSSEQNIEDVVIIHINSLLLKHDGISKKIEKEKLKDRLKSVNYI